MTEAQERQAMVAYFVDELGGVMAGAHPAEKRPRTTRPEESGSAPWDVHQREGHLDDGIDAYIAGRLDDAYLIPGSIELRGGWLACADVDNVSPANVDAPDEGTWADQASHALESACAPVLNFAKPARSGKRHVWMIAAEPVGNGNLFVAGRQVGEWRGRGGTVGAGMRLYPGEGVALMEALREEFGDVLEGELLAGFVKGGFGAAGGTAAAPNDTGKVSTGAGDVEGGAHPKVLGAIWKWVGGGEPFSPSAAAAYLLEHGETPRTPGIAAGEVERMIVGAEGKAGRTANRDDNAGLPWEGTGKGSGQGAGPDMDHPAGDREPEPPDTLAGDVERWKGWKVKAKSKPPGSLSALRREAPALLAGIVQRLAGRTGAVVSLGTVAVLSGAGGGGGLVDFVSHDHALQQVSDRKAQGVDPTMHRRHREL